MALRDRYGFAETMLNGLPNKIKQAAAIKVQHRAETAHTFRPVRED